MGWDQLHAKDFDAYLDETVKMVELYERGLTLAQVARRFSYHHTSVRTRFQKAGVHVRSQKENDTLQKWLLQQRLAARAGVQ